jgi:hypothetical protein
MPSHSILFLRGKRNKAQDRTEDRVRRSHESKRGQPGGTYDYHPKLEFLLAAINYSLKYAAATGCKAIGIELMLTPGYSHDF